MHKFYPVMKTGVKKQRGCFFFFATLLMIYFFSSTTDNLKICMYLFTFQNHYQNKERYILSKITMDCRNEVFFRRRKCVCKDLVVCVRPKIIVKIDYMQILTLKRLSSMMVFHAEIWLKKCIAKSF